MKPTAIHCHTDIYLHNTVLSGKWWVVQVVICRSKMYMLVYVFVCACPFPGTSLDRWHPLALWLACHHLNMLMGPLLQAETFIYKCKFKSVPFHPDTCTTLPLTVQDWFGCFLSTETVKWTKGWCWTPQNNHEMLQIVNRDERVEEGNDSQKCPNQENFIWKPSRKLLTPYFFLSYSNDVSPLADSSSGLRGKWQAPLDLRSDHAVNPNEHLWDWIWIVGEPTPHWHNHHWFCFIWGVNRLNK